MEQAKKTVIITGASGGIGRATAAAFAEDGYNLVLTGTRADALDALADTLGAPKRVLTCVADVSIAGDRTRLVESSG